MRGAVDLSLSGSDGAQCLLEMWDRISLRDVSGFLYLAAGLDHS